MRLTLIALLLACVVGCDPTPEEKFEATLKAAERGNAGAQYELGGMYYYGQGVPEDYTESAKWYRKAAEQGHAEAQFYLGLMYRLGYGVPEDYAEAAKWCRKAAERGYAKAQWMLGGIYVDGEGGLGQCEPKRKLSHIGMEVRIGSAGQRPNTTELGCSFLRVTMHVVDEDFKCHYIPLHFKRLLVDA